MNNANKTLARPIAVVACCAIVCGSIVYLSKSAIEGVFNGIGAETVAQSRGGPEVQFRHARAAAEAWRQQRTQDMEEAAQTAAVLADARGALAAVKPRIPREMAICLEARARIDDRVRGAVIGGGDVAADLEAYKRESKAVETYCAYAMQIGSP